MTFGERLVLIREKANINQKDFAKTVGITNSSMSRAERDQQGLGSAVKMVICSEFKIRPQWLDTGEGEMYKQAVSAEEIVPELVDVLEANPTLLKAVVKATTTFTGQDWRKLNDFLASLGGVS